MKMSAVLGVIAVIALGVAGVGSSAAAETVADPVAQAPAVESGTTEPAADAATDPAVASAAAEAAETCRNP